MSQSKELPSQDNPQNLDTHTEEIDRISPPRDGSGIAWRKMPEQVRNAYLEQRARSLVSRYGNLSGRTLGDAQEQDMVAGMRYYPGEKRGLLKVIGVAEQKKPYGYWTPEQTLIDVRKFVKEYGDISEELCIEKGQSTLISGIMKYPGGLTEIRKALGIKEKQKPHGYWQNIETIESEAREFFKNHRGLTLNLLTRFRNFSLLYAINTYYPGGIFALREKLNIPHSSIRTEKGSWSRERIEAEARQFYMKFRKFSKQALSDEGYRRLASQIRHNYPGGFKGIKAYLQIEDVKPHGYWKDVTTILREAESFYRQYGILSHRALKRYDRGDLDAAISLHYPGGIISLKQEIIQSSSVSTLVELLGDEYEPE